MRIKPDKRLKENDPLIVNRRTDYFGDRWQVGDGLFYVLIYTRRKDDETVIMKGKKFVFEKGDLHAEMTHLTPRSLRRIYHTHDYDGTEYGTPRFYEKGIL